MVSPAPHTDQSTQRLQDRVAIVTGSGRGIGKAIAQLFARHGAKVLVATRTGHYGQQTVDEIRANGGSAALMEVTIGPEATAQQVVETAIEQWGRLDIVVHNAAFLTPARLVEVDDAALTAALEVGVKSAVWLMKHAHPFIARSPGGRFLFTSSVAAERSQPGYACYGAVKGAINALVRGAAVELGPDRITVNAVAPGGTRSASFDASVTPEAIRQWEPRIPLGRVGEGQDIANAMLFLASDEAPYITGRTLTVDGGQTLGQPSF